MAASRNKSDPNITTSIHGFRSKPMLRDITKADFVKICEKATSAFRLHGLISSDEYFKIEAITEGGFVLLGGRFGYAGDNDRMYKSMRFFKFNMPIIDKQTVMTDWRDSRDVLLRCMPQKFANSCFKLFHDEFSMITRLQTRCNAPRWTRNELRLFADVLSEFGIEMHKFPPLSTVPRQ
jgi:hypothetical protein